MKYPNIDLDIREVQLVQLEILNEFDRICKKNNLTYQLFAGTLLGAVRHQGFIPWDDDIDVCMLRDDYEKFIKIAGKELDSKFFLQNYLTDSKSYLQFTKIRKNNTIFVNSTDKYSSMHKGIYIDIFPLDYVKNDSFFGKIQPYLFQFYYILSSSKIRERAKKGKNTLRRIIRFFLYLTLSIVPKKFIDSLAQKTLKKYNNKTLYINHLTNGVNKLRLQKYIRKLEGFNDVIQMKFENRFFPVPRNYHEILTRNFGEYMNLPPEEKRYPHHGIIEVNLQSKM